MSIFGTHGLHVAECGAWGTRLPLRAPPQCRTGPGKQTFLLASFRELVGRSPYLPCQGTIHILCPRNFRGQDLPFVQKLARPGLLNVLTLLTTFPYDYFCSDMYYLRPRRLTQCILGTRSDSSWRRRKQGAEMMSDWRLNHASLPPFFPPFLSECIPILFQPST